MRILLIGCEVVIRKLQLAKGAVAVGFRLLSDGCQLDPSRIFVTGTFGNYVRGVRMLLLTVTKRQQIVGSVLSRTGHVELATDPRFQDLFVGCMRFPVT